MGIWIRGFILLSFIIAILLGNMTGQNVGSPPADVYWTQTKVSEKELFSFLEDRYCYTSDRYFLACLNAVQQVAVRHDHYFDPHEGLVPRKFYDTEVSERELLAPWLGLMEKRVRGDNLINFPEAWEQLKSEFIKEHQLSMMIGVALNGFLSVFRDPHTYLMPIEYYNQVVASSEYRLSSYGFILGRSQDAFIIKKVIMNSPAAQVGLRRGDQVLSLNDWDISKMSLNDLNDQIRHGKNKILDIVVRSGAGKRRALKVFKANQALSTVHIRYVEGTRRIGILTLDRFAKGTCDKVKSVLRDVRQSGTRNLIIDLRDNPGGQMDETGCVASLFTGPDKEIFTVRYMNNPGRSETFVSDEDQIFLGRIVAIINRGTASAAEILAGVLREYKRALLIGERTFGKGSFQEGDIWNLNPKIALFETKGFYFLPSGFSPQKIGIEPDIPLVTPNNGSREEDQYWSTLQIDSKARLINPPVGPAFESCSLQANTNLGLEDPELNQAQQALNCWGVAHASGG